MSPFPSPDAWLAAQGVRVPARLAAALTPWGAAP
jgi:hypothetical protein